MDKQRLVIWLFLFLGLATIGWCGDPPPPLEEREALLELQKIAVHKPVYNPEIANRIKVLVFTLWDKPRFRHQVTTILNMNNGQLDYIFNQLYLDSMTPAEHELPNFAKVERRLYRGGQPTTAGYARLRKLGVKTVVNLRAEDRSEETLVKGMGMQYRSIPIPDTQPPTPAQIAEFLTIMRSRDSGKIFVHCAAGRSRTSTMVAIWRIENGWTPDAAFKEAVKLGFSEKLLAADRQAELIRNYKKR